MTNNLLGKNITEYLLRHFDKNFVDNYNEYLNSTPAAYIRIASNVNADQLIERLLHYKISLRKVYGVENAYEILSGGDIVGKTVEYILGEYYIQSLSSMIPPLILNPGNEDKVMDLCSAPGSKTTQLARLMNNSGLLYANESSSIRVRSLVFNLEKMGIINSGVINSKGENLSGFFNEYFDKILVDAPCSALGIIQKKIEVDNWWNSNQAEQLSNVQYKLLLSAIKMCKPGGEILYSTCTLTLEENELVLQKILEKYPVEIMEIELPVKSHSAFTKFEDVELSDEIGKARRIFPWEINSEGFFIAKLKKTGLLETAKISPGRKSSIELITAKSKKVKKLLERLSEQYDIDEAAYDDYKFLIKGNDIFFINAEWETEHAELFLRIGNKFGKSDKREKIFLNSFAARMLDRQIKKNIFIIENAENLKTYMTGGTIKTIYEPFGQKAVSFRGKIIGTASASANGVKSQFPRNLRTQAIVFPEKV